jgi:hypothetical protein
MSLPEVAVRGMRRDGILKAVRGVDRTRGLRVRWKGEGWRISIETSVVIGGQGRSELRAEGGFGVWKGRDDQPRKGCDVWREVLKGFCELDFWSYSEREFDVWEDVETRENLRSKEMSIGGECSVQGGQSCRVTQIPTDGISRLASQSRKAWR